MYTVTIITAIFDILTLIVSTVFLIKNIKKIKFSARYIIWLIIFVLYIVPLYIDYFYMLPDYPSQDQLKGFTISRIDSLTCILFDIFFIYLQYRLLYYKGKDKISPFDTSFELTKGNRLLLFLGMTLAPLVVLLFVRQPFMLYTFGWRELGIIEPPRFYDQAEQFCYFSSSCALLLLFERRKGLLRNILQKIIALGFVYMVLSIQGKRAMLFFVMISILVILYFVFIDRIKNNRNWKIFLLYGFVLLGLAGFYMSTISLEVQVKRGNTYAETSEIVTSQRVDFFRDDRVRMAIYSEVHPDEMQILHYRGQTIIPDIFGLLPLNYLRDRIGVGRKVYQTYFTCSLCGDNINSSTVMRDSNWMTVTFISEVISNFSLLLAFLIVPFLCLKTSKLVNKLRYPFNILVILAFVMFNLFDTTYVVVYVEFMIIFYLVSRKKKHKTDAIKYKICV